MSFLLRTLVVVGVVYAMSPLRDASVETATLSEARDVVGQEAQVAAAGVAAERLSAATGLDREAIARLAEAALARH